MQGRALKNISIVGLHHYLNIDLDFNPGVNVIYGKNGKGKTTVLHIIANILELDFARFLHLQFDSIKVEAYNLNVLELLKSKDNKISILFNGFGVGADVDESGVPKISAQEAESISKAFGGRPVYLPAYRAILERVKANSYDTPNTPDYEIIKATEVKSLTRNSKSRFAWHNHDARAAHIARKTVQCRDWFGAFVPVIRYPGLAEVIETLSEEFGEAQNEASQSERRMLSSMFIGVFKSLVSTENTPSDWEIEPLIERVKKSLAVENDDSQNRPDAIGISLAEEIAQAKSFSSPNESAAQKRVLKLYADMLETRNEEKMVAFHKIRTFEAAVNLFLDGKSLKVSEYTKGVPNKWREFAYIEADNGNCYNLSTLSSGERQILTMLFSATRMSATDTGVFLIDEPELSLHVDWQRIILTELNAQAPSRQIIACTHSPEVGADHESAVQMFSPRISSKVKSDPVMDESSFMDDL
jgi:predicted ATPase